MSSQLLKETYPTFTNIHAVLAAVLAFILLFVVTFGVRILKTEGRDLQVKFKKAKEVSLFKYLPSGLAITGVLLVGIAFTYITNFMENRSNWKEQFYTYVEQFEPSFYEVTSYEKLNSVKQGSLVVAFTFDTEKAMENWESYEIKFVRNGVEETLITKLPLLPLENTNEALHENKKPYLELVDPGFPSVEPFLKYGVIFDPILYTNNR
ncbi:hypothetical protein EJF36_07790 [Bacillus sp. HMF5848]|uniref:hypothetical protein n=1 Tax=Bacillus sp. HMF5848 TaxID=2495421 RepID=UPI000F773587|nr:hypothetical protein [Bacillus sp. HMF5848]RSK26770.1 hypothetical protein EJF36_07790 [Bacillus sp. HMF5848]